MDAKTIISIIGLIVSVLSLLGFGTVMSMLWKDRHSKRAKELADLLELQNKKLDENIRNIISEELDKRFAPYEEAVKTFTEDIALLKSGVQVNCRSDLQDMVDKAEKLGYATDEDKQRWDKTYESYHKLGKNGVMDSRNEWYMKLPSKPKPKQTRQRLTETKK